MSQDPPFNLPNIEILNLIGRGGMASVWRARQISLDRLVAVKILSPDFTSDSEDVQRFRREAQTAARLKHSGIVQVYDANFSGGAFYFVMELVEGYTFGDLLRRKGRLAVEDVLIVAESVAVALDYAWSVARMIHCDLKPDNIMVDADGTVKVTDLGICRSVTLRKESSEGQSDEILGTPGYMSPEQVYGLERLDCRADIYALGATLYHLLTGRMLFDGMPDEALIRCHVDHSQAPDVRLQVSEATGPLALFLEKLLVKTPEHRTRDWRQVLIDLNRLRKGQPPCPALVPDKGSSMARVRS